jgi:hypothetical protein
MSLARNKNVRAAFIKTFKEMQIRCYYSFSREFWFLLLRKFGLHYLAPQPDVGSYLGWWESVGNIATGLTKKALIPLSFWEPGPCENLETNVFFMAATPVLP